MKYSIILIVLVFVQSENWLEKSKKELRDRYQQENKFEELVRDPLYSQVKLVVDSENIRNTEICEGLIEILSASSLKIEVKNYDSVPITPKSLKCTFAGPFNKQGDYYENEVDKQITAILRPLDPAVKVVLGSAQKEKIEISNWNHCYYSKDDKIYFNSIENLVGFKKERGLLEKLIGGNPNEGEMIAFHLLLRECLD